jgi:hypothetical protein
VQRAAIPFTSYGSGHTKAPFDSSDASGEVMYSYVWIVALRIFLPVNTLQTFSMPLFSLTVGNIPTESACFCTKTRWRRHTYCKSGVGH